MSGEFFLGLSYGQFLILAGAVGLALAFEFVNGFHDTANAVATIIYTKTLEPGQAVAWSGLCNMIGIFMGGIGVAYSIVHLLPVELLVAARGNAALGMVLSLLFSALLWNLGTWYFGIPASSSHALVGSILGIGAANAVLRGHPAWTGINWTKVGEVGLSLLLSPLLGFALSGLLQILLRRLVPVPALHLPPIREQKPPGWVRAVLVGTCSGVSFAHGSNDGQKGMGLIMLILIGVAPAHFALNPVRPPSVDSLREAIVSMSAYAPREARHSHADSALRILADRTDLRSLPPKDRWDLRAEILHLTAGAAPKTLTPAQLERWRTDGKILKSAIEYVPNWVVVAIALSLGIGTMVGWKRIVVTVGEKIGKTHLTYSQGAAAEMVAMGTIGLASLSGMPVSTTHVLSSGIAGTMAAARSGVNGGTVRSLALAWILTLPVTSLMAAALFLLFQGR